LRPVVAEVAADTPFAEAGFRDGDEILAIGDRETPTWEAVVHALLESMDEERGIEIRVREEGGLGARRVLSSEGLLGHLEDADPLARLGITQGPRLPAMIGEVVAGEAAAAAGILPGDQVLRADNQEISGWSELVAFIQARPGQEVELLVERDGSSQPILVTLGSVAGDNGPVGRIGAGVEVPEGFFDRYRVVVREGPIEAVGSAIDKTWSMASLMLEMLWKMMEGEASVEKNLGSVISIAKAAGQTAEYGIAPFLKFLAQISIVLAVMNLLPIPMLDGGHLMFYGIEAVRGKPLSSEAQERFDRVGLALLLTLITFALYLDLIRLLG
jgi:regulator of sigma E protease